MTAAQVFSDVLSIAARHDSGFPARVRGASDDDVRRLQAATGAPLPDVYRAFLAVVGQGMGGLTPLGATFRVADLLPVLGRYRAPPGYMLIGLQEEAPNLDVFLDLQGPEASPGAGPPVVRFEAADTVDQVYPAYPSLPDMVLSAAFARFRMAALPHRALLVPRGPTWPEERRAERPAMLASIARLHGFERLLHTSLPTACYDKPGAAMLLYAPRDLSFCLEIGASSKKALDAAIADAAEPLSLAEQRIS